MEEKNDGTAAAEEQHLRLKASTHVGRRRGRREQRRWHSGQAAACSGSRNAPTRTEESRGAEEGVELQVAPCPHVSMLVELVVCRRARGPAGLDETHPLFPGESIGPLKPCRPDSRYPCRMTKRRETWPAPGTQQHRADGSRGSTTRRSAPDSLARGARLRGRRGRRAAGVLGRPGTATATGEAMAGLNMLTPAASACMCGAGAAGKPCRDPRRRAGREKGLGSSTVTTARERPPVHGLQAIGGAARRRGGTLTEGRQLPLR